MSRETRVRVFLRVLHEKKKRNRETIPLSLLYCLQYIATTGKERFFTKATHLSRKVTALARSSCAVECIHVIMCLFICLTNP